MHINLPSAKASYLNSRPGFSSTMSSKNLSRCYICYGPEHDTTKYPLLTWLTHPALAQKQNTTRDSPSQQPFYRNSHPSNKRNSSFKGCWRSTPSSSVRINLVSQSGHNFALNQKHWRLRANKRVPSINLLAQNMCGSQHQLWRLYELKRKTALSD